MKKSAVILVVLFMALVNFTFAQSPGVVTSAKPGWHKIGEVKASFKMENESIVVIGNDKFKSLKLKVTEAPINIENVRVFYENGASEEISVRSELKSGAETRVIDLDHSAEDIKKVEFTYKTLPNRKDEKAHIELYGLK